MEWLRQFWPYEAVAQAAQQLDQVGMDVGEVELEQSGLALLLDDGVELLLHLLDHRLDARRVDAPVRDQALERDARDLAAEGIEAGEDDRLGSVVDDQVDAGRHLERPDVASLAADDPALHLVGRQHHHRHRGLGDVVGGRPLDRHRDDPLRLAQPVLARLVFHALEHPRRLHPGVALHHPHQLFLGSLRGETADLLQTLALLDHHLAEVDALLLDLHLELVELTLALARLRLAPLDRPLLAREVVVELGDATLLLVELGALLRRYFFELAAGLRAASPWRRARSRAA